MKQLTPTQQLTIIIGLLVLTQSCTHSESRLEKKPNVILIMTDDQGYGDLACHGNPIIKTPNLDDFYSESIRFTDFHVNAFCAPTRAALMTGRMSDRTHVRSTVYSRNHLNREETTMAEFFKASGYHTGLFGKWHLGRNYPYRPIDRGFEQWVGHGDGGTGTASDYWDNDKMNDTYIRNGKWEKLEGFGNDIFFNEALNFISKNKDESFFVYLATNIPHAPWNIQNEWSKTYKNIDRKNPNWESEMDFLSTISQFDKNFGKLKEFLSTNKLDENTIILFLTDNGTVAGDVIYNAGMKGKKGWLYEGGHRVPLFIHWPAGKMNEPMDIDQLTSHIDILPTLIDLCDLKTPDQGHLKFDGRSLVPLIKKEKPEWEKRVLFQHSQNTSENYIKWKNSLVYTEGWRLLGKNELYNIKTDPEQENNLADQYPEIVQELSKKYDAFWEEIQIANNPYPRPIIGSGYDEETWLTCDAWILDDPNIPTWDQSHVLSAVKNNGLWPIEIASEGEYQFDVRRWPKEIDHPISAALSAKNSGDIFSRGKPVIRKKGIAIPAVKVRLEIGEKKLEIKIKDIDNSAVFNVQLPAGPTNVKAWLIDIDGNEQGAYYIYVSKTKT
ncbi:arylsulfatase [Lutibacter citreus]|uniref:arylsulfatase n=1 Tax=Lutibacter citreus TaxID=2138210 RepID=UPI000DBE45A2|nr:arylsulfatase [Lutibacter citreus]